ncbi:M14 family metallopeptidase [Halobacteriovorax sp.]|uniref:M14 family metallopeptidase n=1 Tax=Halobacteriovorax sp. TaxID=2020862 RepID=UPI003AF25C44
MKKFILAAWMLSQLTSYAHSSSTKASKVLTINAKSNYAKTLKSLQENGFDVLGVDIKNELIDVALTKDEFIEFKKYNFKINESRNELLTSSIDERYLNSVEVEALMTEYAEKYPTIAKKIKIGETLEGRSIYAMKISDNVDEDEVSEPSVLFNGMHHSREIMTAEVTTDIIKELLTKYNKDQKITHWVDSNEIYVLPIVNIDGNIKVWEGENMWRKNARGGYGVDINRNYPTNWNACRGSSGWKFSQTYRGSEAASEPETNVLMNFVSQIKPVFNISYHAYSELVIYPYGCRGQRTLNREVVEGIGKELGRVLNYTPGTAWETLYSVDGSDIDWMYEQEQVIPYVIEVSPRSDGFQPSYDKRDPTVAHNRLGWQLLLDRLDGPMVRGINKNATTIKVENEDFSTEYRINPDGSYFIVLPEGSKASDFKLSFKK